MYTEINIEGDSVFMESSMHPDSMIYVAGHQGLAGSHIHQHLLAKGYTNVLVKTRAELDLTQQADVERFFERYPVEYVFLAAAKVGGIIANERYGGDFIRENLSIQLNVIDAAYRHGVKKLLFLASSCIYPKLSPQPIREDYLLTGPLESTNEPFAIAKIAGIKMCQAYRKQYGFNAIVLMLSNLYGPGDNFDLQNSHVIPALMRRFHEAKQDNLSEVTLWGTGRPRREFLHGLDMAGACLYLMQQYSDESIINVGTGQDISIADLAALIAEVVGYRGKIIYDTNKPDGTPKKLMDISRLKQMGWQAKIDLRQGLQQTYGWFLENSSALRQEPQLV
jgi:GDP-L-fucose synthase